MSKMQLNVIEELEGARAALPLPLWWPLTPLSGQLHDL